MPELVTQSGLTEKPCHNHLSQMAEDRVEFAASCCALDMAHLCHLNKDGADHADRRNHDETVPHS